MIRVCAVFTVLVALLVLAIEKPGVVLALCNASYSASGASNCTCSSGPYNCTGTSYLAIAQYRTGVPKCAVQLQVSWNCPNGNPAKVALLEGVQGTDTEPVNLCGNGAEPCNSDTFHTTGTPEFSMSCSTWKLLLRLDDNTSCGTCGTAEHLKWIDVACDAY